MSQPNQVACPHCGKIYSIAPEQWAQYQGRQIPCTQCNKTFMVGPPAMGSPAGIAGQPNIQYSAGRQAPGAKTSGVAIAALVLGILGMCLPMIASIPAIVCGAIGIGATAPGRAQGRGLAITGLVLGILGTLLAPCMVSIMLPALNRAREQANRVKCAANLRMLGQEMLLYSNAHPGSGFPDSWQTMITDPGWSSRASDLICPSSKDTASAGATSQQISADVAAGGHCSYVYVGGGRSGTDGATTVVAYEPVANHRDGANMLFADGHVAFFPANVATPAEAEISAGQNPPPSLNGH